MPSLGPELPSARLRNKRSQKATAPDNRNRLLGFHLRPLTFSLAALVASAGLGCGRSEKHVGSVGTGGDGSAAEAGHPGTGGSDTTGSGGIVGGRGGSGGSAGSTGASAGSGDGGVPPDPCLAPSPPVATLQRLDNFEYDN